VQAQPQEKKAKTDVSAANGSSTVFVKNLPWSADEDTIAEFFGDCGTVANVRIGE
jgi:nucleolin